MAIAFRTPTYRIQQVEQPVQVFIQLKRPSDGAISESLPFQMLPLGSGRPAFWSLRKAFARKKADYNTFNKILATEAAMLASDSSQKFARKIDEFNNNDFEAPRTPNKISALRALNDLYNIRNNVESNSAVFPSKFANSIRTPGHAVKGATIDLENNEIISDPIKIARDENNEKLFGIADSANANNLYLDNEQLICRSADGRNSQKSNVADRDAIILDKSQTDKARADWFDYTEVGKWVEKGQECLAAEADGKNDDDSSKSLKELLTQVAELDQIYADTHTKIIRAGLERDQADPQMEVDVCDNQTYTSLQMAMKNPVELFDANNDRKYEDVNVCLTESRMAPASPPPLVAKRDPTREPEERLPPLPPKRIRKMPSMPVLSRISSCQTINEGSEAPNKNLPSLPGTLLKPSKQGLFSKLFTKRSKKDKDPAGAGVHTPTTNSTRSLNVRDSITSLSKNSVNEMPHSPALPRPSMASVTSVKSFELNGDENPLYGMDLTEAEHYALYTAMAPHATTSEFDEMSFYYSPVEGGKILTEAKES